MYLELTEQDIIKLVQREIRHNDLMDMPQGGSTNRDHDGRYHRKHAHTYMDIENYIYLGDPATNGSWRIWVTGGQLEFQKLVAGTWTYYARFG